MVYTKISPWTFRILKIQVLRYQEVHTPASFIHMILLSPTLRCHSANLVTRIALRSVKASKVHKCTIRSCVLWKLKFVCFVFHAFQPCNLSMRHSTHLYIVECTPDLVSVIHLDSYSNCVGSTCLWHFDHQVFKAPQSLVGGFTLHGQRWSYQRFTKKLQWITDYWIQPFWQTAWKSTMSETTIKTIIWKSFLVSPLLKLPPFAHSRHPLEELISPLPAKSSTKRFWNPLASWYGERWSLPQVRWFWCQTHLFAIFMYSSLEKLTKSFMLQVKCNPTITRCGLFCQVLPVEIVKSPK